MQTGRAVRTVIAAVVVIGGIHTGVRLAGPSDVHAAEPLIVDGPVVLEVRNVGLAGTDETTRVVIYGSGDVMFGAGRAPREMLADTLRLEQFGAFTADVTRGDLHVGVEGPGELSFAATVSNGPAVRLGGRGRHLVVLRGGVGIEPRK